MIHPGRAIESKIHTYRIDRSFLSRHLNPYPNLYPLELSKRFRNATENLRNRRGEIPTDRQNFPASGSVSNLTPTFVHLLF
jgi:hypothetical protein